MRLWKKYHLISRIIIQKHLWSWQHHTRMDNLKTHMLPLVKNNKCVKYLNIWSRVFTSETIREECKNILPIFEIMSIVTFTNAKVEPIFSEMNRVKTDSWNRLLRARLDVFLKEPQTISIYWFYLLCNHVATSTKSKLFVTYTFAYP